VPQSSINVTIVDETTVQGKLRELEGKIADLKITIADIVLKFFSRFSRKG
jgi:hypothetical protein